MASATRRPWRLLFERRTPPAIEHLMGYWVAATHSSRCNWLFQLGNQQKPSLRRNIWIMSYSPIFQRKQDLTFETCHATNHRMKDPACDRREVRITGLAFLSPVQVKTNDVVTTSTQCAKRSYS